jgi:hypothetical protein
MATDILGGIDLGIFNATPGIDPGTYGEATGKEGYQFGDPDSSSVSASNIFGWTWLGNWIEHSGDAPLSARTFIAKWVKKFNDEVVLGTGDVQYAEEAFIQNFLADLAKQTWWKNRTAAWQAVQKLRYGVDVPRGEYDALVDSTTQYVVDYAKALGFRDVSKHSIDPDFVEDLISNASKVGGNGLPVMDENLADGLIDEHYLPERQLGEEFIEGTLDVGPGSLKDLYDKFKFAAQQNYVSVSDEELWDLVTRVKREDMNWQSAYDVISRKVGDQYGFLNGSAILDRINDFSYNESTSSFGGSSLRNYLEPLRATLADVWELDSSEVRLQDTFGPQLDSLTVGEGDDERFMNSREMRAWARTQPQFQQTSAYSQGMSNIMSSMLQMFGVR